MSQFSAMGYPVLFVENTGVRMPGLKDAPRVLSRMKKVFAPAKMTTLKDNKVEIYSPATLPFPYAQPAVKINSAILRSRVNQFSTKHNIPINRILLWSYMTTPVAVELAHSAPWAGVVVDLVSDPCKVQGAEAIVASHQRMLCLADRVFCASATTLYTADQYIGGNNKSKLELVEDGFSTELAELAQNEDETHIPGANPDAPFVAYIGGVNSKIWWEAVSMMARQMPKVNFVFVGPKDYDALPCEGFGKNVFWLPQFARYSQLGAFLKKCQAGLIPYKPTSYVMEMRPAKINEYMVTGLPIVATKMPEMDRLEQQYGPGIAYLAETAKELADVVRHALDDDCEDYKIKRRQITQNNSWEKVCREIELRLHGE